MTNERIIPTNDTADPPSCANEAATPGDEEEEEDEKEEEEDGAGSSGGWGGCGGERDNHTMVVVGGCLRWDVCSQYILHAIISLSFSITKKCVHVSCISCAQTISMAALHRSIHTGAYILHRSIHTGVLLSGWSTLPLPLLLATLRT